MSWWNPFTWHADNASERFADRVVKASQDEQKRQCKQSKCCNAKKGKGEKKKLRDVEIGEDFYIGGLKHHRMSLNYVRREDGDILLLHQLGDIDTLYVWMMLNDFVNDYQATYSNPPDVVEYDSVQALLDHNPAGVGPGQIEPVYYLPPVNEDAPTCPAEHNHVQHSDPAPSHHSYDGGHSSHNSSYDAPSHSSYDSGSHSSYDSGSSSYDSGSSSCDSGGCGGCGD